jgi:hypothetical protein
MQVKTRVTAGGQSFNHNETLVQGTGQTEGLTVKTRVRAGGQLGQHNETLVRAKDQAPGLTVRAASMLGAPCPNTTDTGARQEPGNLVVKTRQHVPT